MTLLFRIARFILPGLLLVACGLPGSPAGQAPPEESANAQKVGASASSSEKLPVVLYYWKGDMPQDVLDDFTRQTGIPVEYRSYRNMEEAVASLKSGASYDLAVIENEFVPELARNNALSEIHLAQIPNFKNISPSFLDLAYDPGNRYTVPNRWGVAGLLSRPDLLGGEPVRSWNELFNRLIPGKIGLPRERRVVLGAALKALGFSINTENAAEIQQALALLESIRGRTQFVTGDDTMAAGLVEGQLSAAVGYSGSALLAIPHMNRIQFIVPSEGALLWGDNFVIPDRSRNPAGAARLLNFLLQPEISARVVNATHYATANEAASPLIEPGIHSNPIIYPSQSEIEQAEFLLPLSPEARSLYQSAWEQLHPDVP